MEDLTIDELKQLVTFYRQKSSDLELTLLQTQIHLNKFMSAKSLSDESVSKKETSEKITK
jgi:hypothetical protein